MGEKAISFYFFKHLEASKISSFLQVFVEIVVKADNNLPWPLLVEQPFYCSEQCNCMKVEAPLTNKTYRYVEMYRYDKAISLVFFHFNGLLVALGTSK